MTVRLARLADDLGFVNRPSLRVTQAAALLQVDISTIYKMVRIGSLEAHRIGKRGVRVFADSLRSYQECCRIAPEILHGLQATQRADRVAWRGSEQRESEAYLRSMGCL